VDMKKCRNHFTKGVHCLTFKQIILERYAWSLMKAYSF